MGVDFQLMDSSLMCDRKDGLGTMLTDRTVHSEQMFAAWTLQGDDDIDASLIDDRMQKMFSCGIDEIDVGLARSELSFENLAQRQKGWWGGDGGLCREVGLVRWASFRLRLY